MAIYGLDFYGSSRYGPRVYLEFDAEPLRAVSNGHFGRLDVTWQIPTGAWSEMRLVRNAFGVPVHHEDGALLVKSNSGPAVPGDEERTAVVSNFVDDALEGGRFYYYAIWLYVPGVGEWTRAAYSTGLALKDYGYANRLWELTPAIHRTTTSGLLDNDNETLRSYLSIMGYQLNHIRAEYDSLLNTNDPGKVAGGLLPLMAQQWGQLFEPELGMKQMRQLLRNTVHLYRTKGTRPGILGYVSALSGFGAKIMPPRNLMLDYNDSSAEESVGQWTADGFSLVRHVPDESVDAAPVPAMRRQGTFKLTSSGTGTRTMHLGSADPVLRGIPVQAFLPYNFSVYYRPTTTARQVTLGVDWYDARGALVPAVFGVATTSPLRSGTLNEWTRIDSGPLQAPYTAAYAVLRISIPNAAAGEVFYFDMMQFQAGDSADAYQDARLIDVRVIAPRVNVIPNPSFENDLDRWTLIGDGAQARSELYAWKEAGIASLRLTKAAGSTYTATALRIQPMVTFTVSFYIRPQTSDFRLELHQTPIQGEEVPPIWKDFTGLTPLEWQRVSWTFRTHPNMDGTAELRAGWFAEATPEGTIAYIDAFLAERGAVVQSYFDGATYQFSAETIWEGEPHASKAHYYPQRRAKNFRLADTLPRYIPAGSSFRLTYAHAGGEYVENYEGAY